MKRSQMMNAMKSGAKSVIVKRHTKLLISVLAIAKLKGYVSDYKVEGNELKTGLLSKLFGEAGIHAS